MSAPELQEVQQSVFDVLTWVRTRPGMYIGEPSITRLAAFLTGYTGALGHVGYTLRDSGRFYAFNDWVARRLDFSNSTSGWGNMILARTGNENEAFQKFFTLLDDFRAEAV
jgi:hypothetical protein